MRTQATLPSHRAIILKRISYKESAHCFSKEALPAVCETVNGKLRPPCQPHLFLARFSQPAGRRPLPSPSSRWVPWSHSSAPPAELFAYICM